MASTPKKQAAGKARPNPRAEAKRAAERRQRILMVAGGIGVLLLAVLIAVFSTQEAGQRVTVDDVAGDVEVTGDTLAPLDGDPAADPVRGAQAPRVAGADFDGTPVEIGGTGRPQLVTFMASWCPACQQELPILTTWLNEGGLPDEVDIVAVATSLDAGRPNWPPQDWFEEVGYPGPVLVDDAQSSVARAFGLSATPFWVAVDGDGQVVQRSAGMIPMEQLDALAAQLATS